MSQDEDKKKPDNRWWEFYFVRYFVGTAFGAIVVLFLAMSSSPVFVSQGEVATILKSLKPGNYEAGYIAILATLGLAFCYVASAPVLVLHATRGSLLKVRSTFGNQLILILSGTVLALSGAQSYLLWLALKIKGDPWASQDFYAGTIFLFLITLILAVQFFLLYLSLWGKEKSAFEYYDELVKKRAATKEAGQEYIESYRHLREHGNAFFIVLLELLLGAALFYSPVPWAIMVMLWIFPAAGVWFFGTFLESRNF